MKDFNTLSPILFAIIALLVFCSIVLMPIDSWLMKMSLSEFKSEYAGLAIKMTFVFAISYRILKKLNIESIAGLSPKYEWKYKYLNSIPVYLFILGILSVFSKDFSLIQFENVALLLFACLAVGFAEEFLFRGLLQSLFLKKYSSNKNGILISVLIPAVIFGLFHLINLIKSDSVSAVLVQVVFATFIGFFFGVLVLKTNKIVPVAITHGLINFFFSLAFLPGLIKNEDIPLEESGPSFAPIIITLPLFVIAFLVLRTIKREEVIHKVKESSINDSLKK